MMDLILLGVVTLLLVFALFYFAIYEPYVLRMKRRYEK